MEGSVLQLDLIIQNGLSFYDGTLTRKYHHQSDMLIENTATAQMSNFIKSERLVKAWQREGNTDKDQDNKHF